MPAFKEMRPEDVMKALEGHQDVLSGEVAKEQAFFRAVPCPRCRSRSLNYSVDSRKPFTSGSPLPNKIAICLECETEFDPYTGLILRTTTSPT